MSKEVKIPNFDWSDPKIQALLSDPALQAALEKIVPTIVVQRPIIFLQDFGHYNSQILVCVGATRESVLTFAHEHNFKSYSLALIKSTTAFDRMHEIAGAFHSVDKTNAIPLLLLRPFQDTWDYWETLIHELMHAVQYHGRRINERSDEAEAYLMEYLFKSIRRKLQGVDPL